jgi:transcriptional regulator with XRE-family HTH domain
MPESVLGTRIRKGLREMRMTQRQLSELLDVDQSTVSRWCDGSRPMNTQQLRDVAHVLHRKQSWLLGEDEAPRAEVAV